MITIAIFSFVIIIFIILIFAYIFKKHQSKTPDGITKYKFGAAFKRATIIFAITIISGAFLVAFSHAGVAIQSGYDTAIQIVKDFFGRWLVFSLYGLFYSLLPSMAILLPSTFYILNSNVVPEKRSWLFFAMGLAVSTMVVLINILLFRSIDMIYMMLPFVITGIISCVAVPKWMGDYKSEKKIE